MFLVCTLELEELNKHEWQEMQESVTARKSKEMKSEGEGFSSQSSWAEPRGMDSWKNTVWDLTMFLYLRIS